MRVDLPIPGSPATRTTEPGTKPASPAGGPPPKTRSNSLMLVLILLKSAGLIWESFCGEAAKEVPIEKPFLVVGITVSIKEFHSPHSGHFPNHLGDSIPHCWQINLVKAFGIN